MAYASWVGNLDMFSTSLMSSGMTVQAVSDVTSEGR